jgi:hypothetical protein
MNQNQLFKEIWEEREHISELSGEPLLPFGHWQWHWCFLHILPKGTYPKWKFEKKNIILGTVKEHENQDHIPEFLKLRERLKAEYYKEFYNKTF